MATSDLLIIDRASRRRGGEIEPGGLVAACSELRKRRNWWAGLANGESPEREQTGLRERDVALVVRDPQGRGVAWIDDARAAAGAGARLSWACAEALLAGAGVLWLDSPPDARQVANAWRAIARAHAKAWLGASVDLPEPLCRRVRDDDPAAVERAVRAWLSGDESLAVDLIRSAVAARIARGEPGYPDAGVAAGR